MDGPATTRRSDGGYPPEGHKTGIARDGGGGRREVGLGGGERLLEGPHAARPIASAAGEAGPAHRPRAERDLAAQRDARHAGVAAHLGDGGGRLGRPGWSRRGGPRR